MESLHRSIIVNAPRVFKTAWSMISIVLNERTKAKTLMFSDDGAACLQEIMGFGKAQVEQLLAQALNTDDQEGDAWLQELPADGVRCVPDCRGRSGSSDALHPRETKSEEPWEVEACEVDPSAVRLRAVSSTGGTTSALICEVRVVHACMT